MSMLDDGRMARGRGDVARCPPFDRLYVLSLRRNTSSASLTLHTPRIHYR